MVMDDRAQGDLMRSLHELPDPRAANVRYRLVDIVGISLLAIICDAQGWDDFHDFAEAKYSWLSTFMDLEHGVPSADTFRRVLSRLDPEAFETAFIKWSQAMADGSQGRLVAIDGKSIRRSFERSWDKAGMTHMVSAFACANGQVLAQLAGDDGAIPEPGQVAGEEEEVAGLHGPHVVGDGGADRGELDPEGGEAFFGGFGMGRNGQEGEAEQEEGKTVFHE
jgi:hypothetical protein